MNIVLGITGSIAAYKSLELIRLLKKEGAEVKVVLTESACHFVTPLSCQILSGNEVYLDQFVLSKTIKHLSLSDWADVLVIAPATANIIGKAVNGIADDLLSTTFLSFGKPVLFVPAMDSGMWDNKILQENVKTLRRIGYHILEPGFGPLASGKIGRGRFPSAAIIYKKILALTQAYKDLRGMKFLVSGGRTEEDIDSMRVITNRSSGRMARELLYAIVCRGGIAKSVIGEVSVDFPEDMDIINTRTSSEMLKELKNHMAWCDCLIMAAAVGDYHPINKSSNKLHDPAISLQLEKNQDLLKELTRKKPLPLIVGFSLENGDDKTRGEAKMISKNCDMIVLNNSSAIANEESKATILKKDGSIIKLGNITKWQLANSILDACIGEYDIGRKRHN
ncbi:MAG: bifunctional phosphopantothenoylcysteine decarboxylase/phosphopantothenate--cysteine ligase CoaBC [bacterium]